jgi:glucosyl-3-phosphoglycerate synthase
VTVLRAEDAVRDATSAVVASRIAVCIPARNEAATVGGVVGHVAALRAEGVVHELVVVDDGSADDTAGTAAAAGADVVSIDSRGGGDKGAAMRRAIELTDSDIVVFLDADVTNIDSRFVTHLVAPLLADPAVQLVKPTYRRPLNGIPHEGGRVTELLARPLLRRFWPDLARLVDQPLAGETALRRTVLAQVVLADGYGIEIGLLLDVYERFGGDAIAQVDLGERVHRNRPLRDLAACADDVLAAVLARLDPLALLAVGCG